QRSCRAWPSRMDFGWSKTPREPPYTTLDNNSSGVNLCSKCHLTLKVTTNVPCLGARSTLDNRVYFEYKGTRIFCCTEKGRDPVATATAIALSHTLTVTQFHHLAAIPPEIEWFANLTNANTRRAYQQDVEDFMAFAGLRHPEQFREVTRAH